MGKNKETQDAIAVDAFARRVIKFEPDSIRIRFERTESETVPLGQVSLEVRLGLVLIEDLRLDQTNPRIQYQMQTMGHQNPNQEELGEALWKDSDVAKLKRSVQATGGIIEPIIVQGQDGTVLEGNCRLVCYRKLAEEFPDNGDWTMIKARILPAGVTRDQVNVLLGELHIAGKNEWTPFEQAAHLYEMRKRGHPEEALSEMYRMSKSSVVQKIRAYTLMKDKYLPMTDGSERLLDRWSYFEEFYKRCKPKADKPDGKELEEDFVQWMLDGKFPRGEHVRRLPEVLKNDEARKALDCPDGNIEAAWEIVEAGSPELGSKLFKTVVAACEQLQNAPLSEVNKVRDGDKPRMEKLLNLKSALADFLKQVKVKA